MFRRKKDQPHLAVHEWLAVITFVVVLTFIGTVNLIINQRDISLTFPNYTQDNIHVSFTGAVVIPITITVHRGVQLKEIISNLELQATADLSSLNFEELLLKDQIIDIPLKKNLTVYLEGNVHPRGVYMMPEGSTLKELHKKLAKKPPMTNRKLVHEEVIKFH